jgi:predicted MFS family arabinose efflux permease
MGFPSLETAAGTGRRRQAYAILVCTVALGMLSQFFGSSNGVIGPDLMKDLDLTADQLGLLSGSFFIVVAVLQIPLGIVLDRFGGRTVLSAMLVLAVAGSVIFSLATSFPVLLAARLLTGVGCAGLMVGSLLVLSRWFGGSRFTAAMALLFGLANVGNLLATLPLAAAVERWGWRDSFLGLAVVSGLLAVVFYAVVRDAPSGHVFHRRKRETLLQIAKGLKKVALTPGLFYILPLIAVGYASTIAVLGLWGGPYLHQVHGLDPVERGNVLLFMGAAMTVGTMFYGPLDRHFGTRKGVVLAGGALTVLALLALAALPSGAIALTTVLLCVFAFVSSFSLVAMAHGLALFSDRRRGRGLTTLNTALMGGTALMQAATGALVAFSGAADRTAAETYGLVFGFLAIAIAGALAIYVRVRDIKPSQGRAGAQPGVVEAHAHGGA